MAVSGFGLAMQRQWTPSAQLAIQSLEDAGKMAASMDKKSKTTYERDSSGSLSGLGGIVGTIGGGILGSFVPGIGTAVGMMGGGALGGMAEGAMVGNIGGGLGQGLGMGITGASIPGLFGAEGWGELLGNAAGGAGASAAGAGATESLLAQTAPKVSLDSLGNQYSRDLFSRTGRVI